METEGNTGQEARLAFGAALREHRTRAGLTQDALASLATRRGAPVTQTMVAKVERGARPTPVEEVLAFARALGVPASALLGEDRGDVEDAQLRTLRAAVAEVERQHERLLTAARGVQRARAALEAVPREVLDRLDPLDRALMDEAFWTPVQVLQRQGEE
ncbi:helix-turn-helix domain-containing protein [Kocuria oceani]|uniref:Helix-turn-helix domain-containing protein n=1 Tax=Kocuria oceani TaxID=988827 RepID=A0ABV9THK0_9MICC|nr:helix-turn-helix domain-containing protein [Kocuria oceani]